MFGGSGWQCCFGNSLLAVCGVASSTAGWRLNGDGLEWERQSHVAEIDWIREDQWFWWASLVAQTVKNLPAMQETQVQSLGREDSLAKGMATHPSILVWRIPWAEEPGGQQSMRLQRVSISLIRMQSLWPQGKHFAYCVSFLFLWIGFSSTCLYSCTLNRCLAHEGVCGIPFYLNMQKQ